MYISENEKWVKHTVLCFFKEDRYFLKNMHMLQADRNRNYVTFISLQHDALRGLRVYVETESTINPISM